MKALRRLRTDRSSRADMKCLPWENRYMASNHVRWRRWPTAREESFEIIVVFPGAL